MTLSVCYLLPRLHLGPAGVVVGGCASNCTSLALELKRQGIQIELLAPVPQEEMAHLSGHPLAEIVRPLPEVGAGLVSKGFAAIHALRRALKRRLQESHVNVVHCHSGTFPYAVVPLAAARRRCARLHSLYCPLGAKGGVYGSWWERPRVAGILLNRLDRVIAVTGNVRRSVERTGVRPGKVESIPMCVDTRRFHPRERRGPARYFPAGLAGPRLLFVGNASKQKGLLELLDAVAILKSRGIVVTLAATVENQSRIREYSARYEQAREFVATHGLGEQVRFLGLVGSIEDLYAEADIVVIPWNTSQGPSDYPMVLLEAMAMGKCVVATPVGGCPELLQHGEAGILTEGYSAECVAAGIESALHDHQKRADMQRHALDVARSLSLEAGAKRLIALYEHLLESKNHAV